MGVSGSEWHLGCVDVIFFSGLLSLGWVLGRVCGVGTGPGVKLRLGIRIFRASAYGVFLGYSYMK